MKDLILDLTATVLLFLQDLGKRLAYYTRVAIHTAVWILFVPFFGISGTHFKGEAGLNWMSYNIHRRRLLVQRTKGKTVFLYTIQDVGPLKYLRVLDDGDFHRLLDHHAYEGSWRWRWNGKLTDGRKVAA